MKRFFASIILSAFFTLPLFAQNGNANKAPSISLKDLKSKTVKLTDFKGKVVMLNFWATWCIPCAAEIPDLIKWQDQYRADGLQIVGITFPPANTTKVRNFARKNKINYPVLFGSKATKKLFEPSEILPVTVIIDRKGNVIDRIDGVIFADEFDAYIKPLLTESGVQKTSRSN